MINYGRTSVHELLGDWIVYRNLVPLDPQLPSLAEIRPQLELPAGVTPRKSEPAYGRVIAHLLQQAQQMASPGARIEQLVYVGDTRMNDGAAFANIYCAGGWPGLAFIGAEQDGPKRIKVIEQGEGALYLANRWAAVADFDQFCRERGYPLSERTAVVIDLDKTLLGARGRNDHVIDQARVEAVRRTVGDLLGDGFDPQGFQAAYDRINQVAFHPFTGDNQDYVAYICLILGSELYTLESLVTEVRAGQVETFEQFIELVDSRAGELPPSLRPIHHQIYGRVREKDPTPFKVFRYHEYRTTVERMGWMEDGSSPVELLEKEIVITQEVHQLARMWREQGALLFGLSDKPDEASIPPGDLVAQGYLPIHQVETHAVGSW